MARIPASSVAGEKDEDLIREALKSGRAQRKLAERLDPLVRAPVRIVLRRWKGQTLDGLDEDDLVAEVFASLFDDDCRDLLRYSEQRGTLKNYVSIYARSRVREHEVRATRRVELMPPPGPMTPDVEHIPEPGRLQDELVIIAERAARVRDCLNKKLTTNRAKEMVHLIYDLGHSTDELTSMGYEREQVFSWRSKIIAAARECLEILERENALSPRRS